MDGSRTIDALNAQTATPPPSSSVPPGGNIGKEEFLKLLITQLSHQDPMNPMDGQEFAAQLAQFTSVEQLVNIHSMLAESAEMNGVLAQSINNGVAAGLIGKSVQASGNKATWDGENPAPLHFELEQAAANVTVTIRNEAGVVVRTIELGSRSAGEQSFEWDGATNFGASTSPGAYSYEVSAKDSGGKKVDAQTFTRGVVERISFGRDGILLWLGSHSVPMSAVESVE